MSKHWLPKYAHTSLTHGCNCVASVSCIENDRSELICRKLSEVILIRSNKTRFSVKVKVYRVERGQQGAKETFQI